MKQTQRIKEHHDAAMEEQSKRLRAEQDSEMKSAFLSHMSHELRYG